MSAAWAVILSLAAPSAPSEASRAAAAHALDRLAYGARPGEVDRVALLGVARWIDEQLHPERIADGPVAARLDALRTVRLDSSRLIQAYAIPPEARRELQRQRSELGDSASEVDARRARRELIAKYAPHMEGPPRLVTDELQQAKLLRAIYSERQLDEVLVDFWMNHFNVYADKGVDRFLLGAYERDVIRPYAWGRFEDLLRATAESPAMLFYLDNWLSVERNAGARLFRRPSRNAGQRRRSGLNENYARELLELHTLGVDGGYTQRDVSEVARCFTGWTIEGLRRQQPQFRFAEARHDRGAKQVLGRTIRTGGKGDGDEVLHLLATHPATARLIATKLARRFVADDPPPGLVDHAAARFLETDGDIRAVVSAIVTSREFDEARGTKLKTPLELVVSAVRASGASVDSARELARRVAAMGMPLYEQQPPTGYKDSADAWTSAGGLAARLNFASDLAAGRLAGVVPGAAADAQTLGSPAFQRK
jgi:uncharacterized protein (DUF1800 family)